MDFGWLSLSLSTYMCTNLVYIHVVTELPSPPKLLCRWLRVDEPGGRGPISRVLSPKKGSELSGLRASHFSGLRVCGLLGN